MSKANEDDRIRKAIIAVEAAATIQEIKSIVCGILAPEPPEIPEGCPVLVWSHPSYKSPAYYICEMPSGSHKSTIGMTDNCEIDHQRKGHVIPWGGGECPVDEMDRVTVFKGDQKPGDEARTLLAHQFDWQLRQGNNRITSYVIWPEWVKQ